MKRLNFQLLGTKLQLIVNNSLNLHQLARFTKKKSIMRINFCLHFMVSIFLTLSTFVISCGCSRADERDSLKQVMAAWQKSRSIIHAAQYRIRANILIPKGVYNGEAQLPKAVKGDIPSKDYEYPEEISLKIDFEKNRVRKEIATQLFNFPLVDFKPYRGVASFDGSQFTSSSSEDANAIDAYVMPPEQYKGGFFGVREYPLLFGYGIVDCELTDPRDLRKSPNESEFVIVHRALCNNRECVVLRRTRLPGTKVRDDFWVDINRDGAILRWQRFWETNLTSSLDIDYQQTEHGWLPVSWRGSEFAYVLKSNRKENLLQSTFNVNITESLLNPVLSEQEMQFKLKPGMTVDVSADDHSFHLNSVQADGSLAPFGQRNSRAWRLALIVTTILSVILVAIFTLKRLRRRIS